MAGVFDVVRRTGVAASIVDTIITSATTIASQTDDPTPDASDNIPLPSAGNTNYSFWVTTRLKAVSTPDGVANNLRAYCTADVWAAIGVDLKAKDASTGADAGYRQATSAIILNTTNHTGLDGAPAGMETFNEGAPLALGGSISNPATGFGTFDHLVLQVQVTDTAAAGTLPAWEIFIKRDET